jgi:hypothetical protein
MDTSCQHSATVGGRPIFTHWLAFALLNLSHCLAAEPASSWQPAAELTLAGLRVSLSKPVLVARSRDYLWFPTMTRLSSGELFAVFSTNLDAVVPDRTASASWTNDGGLTWSAPVSPDPAADLYVESTLHLANGDELLYPFNLFPRRGGMGGTYQLVSGVPGSREVRIIKDKLVVTGWPRADQSFNEKLGLSGFGFNGQTLKASDNTYLATLYGRFEGEPRYSLVLAESTDGIRWKYRSTVVPSTCGLQGGEGPCESAICRLKDGRLLTVFRLASNVPYGQTFSSDDGKTWTEAVAMKGPRSVQPSLQVMPDGAVLLSGGRPGLFLWINKEGTGLDWEEVDLLRHHNLHQQQEPIDRPDHTTSYTEIAILDNTHVLYMYDRIPHGWGEIPDDSTDTNSIWVVRLTVE